MTKDRKSILDFLRSFFKKREGEPEAFPEAPSEQTVAQLIDRTLGGQPDEDDEKLSVDCESDSEAKKTDEDGPDEGKSGEVKEEKKGCPYATRRAIVESIAVIRQFADEHKLAASVLKTLLSLLAEIALGALRGKVSKEILEALLRAINYELAIEEAFVKGHNDGRQRLIEERYPIDDDGLPHINGPIHRSDGNSIFDVAAEARR